MEKIVYLLWKDPSLSGSAFRDRLLAKLPHRLPLDGALDLTISVTDDDVSAGAALHMGPLAPDAFVSFWLECSQDRAAAEATLALVVQQSAGYLVVESRPLRAGPGPGAGHRSEGFSLVGCIPPKPGLPHDDFIRHWYEVHRDVAISTQSSFAYVRNEVVRALTPDAPAWRAIVEEGFPLAALDDPRAFYDADGSEERYQEHLGRMIDSCRVFIDMERVDSHPMSEYRFPSLPATGR